MNFDNNPKKERNKEKFQICQPPGQNWDNFALCAKKSTKN